MTKSKLDPSIPKTSTMMMYILASKSKTNGNRSNKWKTYVGITKNLSKRLSQHNGVETGGAKYTKGRSWKLVCCVGGFATDRLVRQCEYTIKHTNWNITHDHPVCRKLFHLRALLYRGKVPHDDLLFSDVSNLVIYWNDYFKERYAPKNQWNTKVKQMNISELRK